MRRRIILLLALPCVFTSLAAGQAATGTEGNVPGTRRTYRLAAPPPSERAAHTRFSDGNLLIIEKLNRADLVHLLRQKEIVLPDTITDNEIDYSPLPLFYDWGDTLGKLLVVDQPTQVFGAYENGRLIRWGPVSTGRLESRTPSGLFHLNWKTKGRNSTVDSTWYLPWYFNFDNKAGISLHQYELPGRPASHSCVRLLEPDAKWIYGWADQWRLGASPWIIERQGTPLLILGRCDYDAPRPWQSLEWLARGITLPPIPPTTQDWTDTGGPE